MKSSDDIIDDSDDDTTGNVKKKVCNSTYVTQTTNYVLCYVETVSRVRVQSFSSMSRASQESCTVLTVPVATYTLQLNTVVTLLSAFSVTNITLGTMTSSQTPQLNYVKVVFILNFAVCMWPYIVLKIKFVLFECHLQKIPEQYVNYPQPKKPFKKTYFQNFWV